jgi:hypothetical protein
MQRLQERRLLPLRPPKASAYDGQYDWSSTVNLRRLCHYELVGVAVGGEVDVGVGVEVGCGIGVTLGSGVGVGVGRLDRGATVMTRLKIMLKTTSRLSTQKMICCPLLRERLTFSSRNEVMSQRVMS